MLFIAFLIFNLAQETGSPEKEFSNKFSSGAKSFQNLLPRALEVHSGPGYSQHKRFTLCCFHRPIRRVRRMPHESSQGSISGLLVRSPEGQVVSQKLHDQSRIFVGVLCHVVKLCNGILKGCAGHFASFIWVIQHLVHEDRVVQSQAKADWMCDQQVFLCHFGRFCICLSGLFCRLALVITSAELGNVAVVVGLRCLFTRMNRCIKLYIQQISMASMLDGRAAINLWKNTSKHPNICPTRNTTYCTLNLFMHIDRSRTANTQHPKVKCTGRPSFSDRRPWTLLERLSGWGPCRGGWECRHRSFGARLRPWYGSHGHSRPESHCPWTSPFAPHWKWCAKQHGEIQQCSCRLQTASCAPQRKAPHHHHPLLSCSWPSRRTAQPAQRAWRSTHPSHGAWRKDRLASEHQSHAYSLITDSLWQLGSKMPKRNHVTNALASMPTFQLANPIKSIWMHQLLPK